MNHKLTLKLDEDLIEKAKTYAKEHHSSLSRLVEDYFRFLTQEVSSKPSQITSNVKKLSGVLKDAPEIDFKKEKLERLLKKHSL